MTKHRPGTHSRVLNGAQPTPMTTVGPSTVPHVTYEPIVVHHRWRYARIVAGVPTILCVTCDGHGSPGDAQSCYTMHREA